MKKRVAIPFAALSLVGCLSFSAGSVTFADTSTSTQAQAATSTPAISEQQAVDIAKKLFTIPDTFTQQSVNLQSNWMGEVRTVYSIMWQGPMVPRKPMDGVNVTIDATSGQVLQYNRFKGADSWSTGSTLSATKAQSIADDWIHKLAPTQVDNLVLQPDPSTPKGLAAYSFWYVRKVNGALVPFDSVQLSVSADGQLNSYNLQWADATFPDATGVMKENDVASIYKNALGLHLQYQSSYGWASSQPKTVLTYLPADSNNRYYGQHREAPGPWIDAMTGGIVGADGQPQTQTGLANLTPIDPSGGKQLPSKLNQPMTEAEAEQLIRAALGLSSDYVVTDKSHDSPGPKPGGQDPSIRFTFRNSSEDTLSAAVDTTTGLIINYSHWSNSQQPGTTPPSISDSQAQQAANDFLRKVFPNLTGAIALVPSTQSRPANGQGPVNVNYVLLVNGISANTFSVTIDPYTVTVEDFFFMQNFAGPFPSPDQAISLSSAQDVYVTKEPLVLQYVLPVASLQPDAKTGQYTYQSQAKLVYAPLGNMPGYLDAITGQWAQFPMPGEDGGTPTDIHGHYGEKEMLLLAQRGVLPMKDGKANPNNKMTRAQFVSLLVRANGMYYGGNGSFGEFKDVPEDNPYYGDIMQAVQQGWIPLSTNFYPDKPITRSDAANILVTFLGWQSLATTNGLFSLPFKDSNSIPSNERGDAAIASALGMIPSVKGNFLPSQSMTVADSAVAIVHALQTQSNNRN